MVPCRSHKDDPNYLYAKIRSEVLDVFQRYILQELKLPQNSALWNAESSLSKQERKLVEIDSELDRQTQTVMEKKQRLRDLRTKFVREVENDEGVLQKVGPVYLDVILEGIEHDIIETNKDLMMTQSIVDRTKTRLDYLKSVLEESIRAVGGEAGTAMEAGADVATPADHPAGEDSPAAGAHTAASATAGASHSSAAPATRPDGGKPLPPAVNTTNLPLVPSSSSLFSPQSPQALASPEILRESLTTSEETLQRIRKERDFHWTWANTLIETREKCKLELRQRKKDSDRDLTSFCEINTIEYQYLAEHRALNEMRVARDFLSHDKIMAVNAREASKQEIKNIQDSVSIYAQRVEQEKNRKRRVRRQSWFTQPAFPSQTSSSSGGGGSGFGD